MSAVLAHLARDEAIAIKLHLMIVPATDMRYCHRSIKQLDKSNCPYESARLYQDLPWGPLGREQWFLKYWLGEDAGEGNRDCAFEASADSMNIDEQARLLNNWMLTPVLAPNFADLPPAHIITAEFDLERDEGEYYGKLLRDAGNEVSMKRYTGVPHAFAHYNHPERGLPKSFDFIEDTAELLKEVHHEK